jgi:malate synthase
VTREDVRVEARDLIRCGIAGGEVTEGGIRGNVSVALQYLEAWLRGAGAVAINNLMEDTATAEIARAQLWQWIHHRTPDETGRAVTLERVRGFLDEELAARTAVAGRWQDAAQLLDALVAAERFPEFLTLMAYRRLEG